MTWGRDLGFENEGVSLRADEVQMPCVGWGVRALGETSAAHRGGLRAARYDKTPVCQWVSMYEETRILSLRLRNQADPSCLPPCSISPRVGRVDHHTMGTLSPATLCDVGALGASGRTFVTHIRVYRSRLRYPNAIYTLIILNVDNLGEIPPYGPLCHTPRLRLWPTLSIHYPNSFVSV